MPYDDPDPEDPMEMVAVRLAADDPAVQEEAALCFVSEFASLGLPRDQIMEIFRNPFYQATHGVFAALGEARIQALIAEHFTRIQSPGGSHAQGL